MTQKRYTVTIYTADPGTPLNDDFGNPKLDEETGNRAVSAAGHMWYEISDGNNKNSYGFAPLETGITGNGAVTTNDTTHYEKPRYSRTIEITETQYNQLKNYGVLSVTEKNPDFNLYYNGASNSCIDFTWKALKSADLTPGIAWNDSARNLINKGRGEFQGDLKVDNNIPHIKTIKAPFPNSELNTQHYNDRPSKTFGQWLLTQNELEDRGFELASFGDKNVDALFHGLGTTTEQFQQNSQALANEPDSLEFKETGMNLAIQQLQEQEQAQALLKMASTPQKNGPEMS